MKSLLITFFILITSATFLLGNSYFNEKSQINLEIPDHWNEVNAYTWRHITLEHEEKIATITVTVFVYPEFEVHNGIEEKSITINGFVQARSTSLYDGWINLFHREGTPYEVQVANVSDNVVAVYSKNHLDDNLRLTQTIVGEYYYLKRNIGYIVSIRTQKKYWQTIQKDVKTIVESFWIGNGEQRPEYIEKEDDSGYSGWFQKGGGKENQNYAPATPNVTSILSNQWQIELPPYNDPPYFSELILTDKKGFFVSNATLIAFSIDSGDILWKYELPNPSSDRDKKPSKLLYYDNILYLTVPGSPGKLLGLLETNGSVLFSRRIDERDYSDPVIMNKKLFIIENDTLKELDRITGEDVYSERASLNPDMTPVVGGESLILVDRLKNLRLYNPIKRKITKMIPIKSDIIYRPIVFQENVIVTSRENGKDSIQAFTIKSGKLLWENSFPENAIIESPSINKENTFILEQNDHGDFLNHYTVHAINNKTGQKVWEKSVDVDQSMPLNRPIVTPAGILFSGGETIYGGVLAFDRYTGELITRPIRDTSNKPVITLLGTQNNDLFLHYIYRDRHVLYKKK